MAWHMNWYHRLNVTSYNSYQNTFRENQTYNFTSDSIVLQGLEIIDWVIIETRLCRRK